MSDSNRYATLAYDEPTWSDGERWYAIGFVMENVAQSKPLMTYGMSVDEVERRTGIDFFYQLPDSVESGVEGDFDFADWTVKQGWGWG